MASEVECIGLKPYWVGDNISFKFVSPKKNTLEKNVETMPPPPPFKISRYATAPTIS